MTLEPTPEGRRVLVAAPAGVLVGAAVATVAPWQLDVIAGWDTTALILLVWIWCSTWRLSPAQTRHVASWQDDSRRTSRLLLLAASSVSLVGVLLAFVKAKSASGAVGPLLTVGGLLTVVLSWLLVHTVFTLRYGHLYYEEPIGGIGFNSSDYEPDYRDLAYVAFTVGMTFQVSDTDITSPRVRKTVLLQSLLSYLFGAVIVAATINIIAGLVR
ncbi:MAG: hypothetical protein JWN46_3552 [Acidimicrobiales bacterium]|nr:hypothetical protein [Acidimicrobiales bacterium]